MHGLGSGERLAMYNVTSVPNVRFTNASPTQSALSELNAMVTGEASSTQQGGVRARSMSVDGDRHGSMRSPLGGTLNRPGSPDIAEGMGEHCFANVGAAVGGVCELPLRLHRRCSIWKCIRMNHTKIIPAQ